ncbi:hypothetical protein [Aliamphritea spongicola]
MDGNPIEGACIDAWSDNADGFTIFSNRIFNRNGIIVAGLKPVGRYLQLFRY